MQACTQPSEPSPLSTLSMLRTEPGDRGRRAGGWLPTAGQPSAPPGSQGEAEDTCFSANVCVFTVHVGADPIDQIPGGSVHSLTADLIPGPSISPRHPRLSSWTKS